MRRLRAVFVSTSRDTPSTPCSAARTVRLRACTIVDRKKDLVIVGGINVYPREVEEVLLSHPTVADAGVIGVPEGRRGEVRQPTSRSSSTLARHPTSRRPELRPCSLNAALSAAGIRYLSVPALGAPRELRAVVSDWGRFADGYRAERLALVREELQRLLPLVASERVCLLCFEADPLAWHRSLLAHEIQGLLDVSTVHHRPVVSRRAHDHESLG